MPGTVTGIDSRGRRYKTINGKRVSVGGDTKSTPSRRKQNKKPANNFKQSYGVRDPINSLMAKYLKGADSPAVIKKDIENLLASKFRLWFAIGGKTSVGKYGRLYAARLMLQALRTGKFDPKGKLDLEDVRKLRKMQSGGKFDSNKFMNFLKEQGVHIPAMDEGPKGQSSPVAGIAGNPGNEDAKILAIVHGYGLSADELSRILFEDTQNAEKSET